MGLGYLDGQWMDGMDELSEPEIERNESRRKEEKSGEEEHEERFLRHNRTKKRCYATQIRDDGQTRKEKPTDEENDKNHEIQKEWKRL